MTVVDTNLKDTVCDIGEVILDGQLEDGVLKELPIVGWFFRAAKSVLTLQDRLFLRKISKFLSSLDDIQQEQRDDFIRKLDDVCNARKPARRFSSFWKGKTNFTKAELKNGFSPSDEQVAQTLLHSGLVEMTVKMPQTLDDIDPGKSGVIYKLSSLGETLADILKERDDRLSTSGPS